MRRYYIYPFEPFSPDVTVFEALETVIQKRQPSEIQSFYTKTEGTQPGLGSEFHFEEKNFAFSNAQLDKSLSTYTQTLKPRFHLIIVGSEHDAVQLCYFASLTGWEITIVASVKDHKTIANFPGASRLVHLLPEEISSLSIDNETAVILMTHSYTTDLKFLIELKNTQPAYLGLLGPVKRRNQLLNEFSNTLILIMKAYWMLLMAPQELVLEQKLHRKLQSALLLRYFQ
jgi:xanthine dehydrogenase accessory factor